MLPEGEITDLSQLPSAIPSYLISVIPELKVNGETVKSGNAMRLGDELDLIYQVKTPLETQAPYTYKVIAGSYLALASIGEGVGSQKLKELQTRLSDTKAKLESQDQAQIASLTREDILGDMFHAGVLGYFAEYSALSHIMALQQRVGHNLAIGYGSYGYEPNVSYFFGIPRAIETGGVVMNVRLGTYVATQGNENEKRIQFRQQVGMLSSALESAIPEQMFVTPENPGEAISAVKAIAKATQQGQKIYHITQANMATVLPNIHHDPLVMDEIRSALAVGKEVTTHSDDVSVPGWTGAGYIIMDPDTGIGAYKIGGGVNGGSLDKLGGVLNGVLVWVGIAALILLTPLITFALAALVILLLGFSLIYLDAATIIAGFAYNIYDFINNCNNKTMAIALATIMLAVNIIVAVALAITVVGLAYILLAEALMWAFENIVAKMVSDSPLCTSFYFKTKKRYVYSKVSSLLA